MNQLTFNILKSLFFTALVSTIVGLLVFMFNAHLRVFVAGFTFTFLAQFIVFYFWQGWLLAKQNQAEVAAYTAYAQQNLKQSISLVCAYCRSSNTVNINVNEENVFQCMRCNQRNMVMMEFSTAQVTVPQDSDTIYKSIENVANNITAKTKDLSEPISFT